VFDEEGHICQEIHFSVLASHIWFSETGAPWDDTDATPFLGIHEGRAYAVLYNGVLGDKSVNGGNVLTRGTLQVIREAIQKADYTFTGPLTVYGERCA
jgi:adenine-specific DNA-methyltransferase